MELDWTAVREDEDSQIVQLTENSICCGAVYEVDVCMNFRLCLHLLGKYGLAIPYPKTFEMAFLLLNEQRGIYTAPISGKKSLKKRPSKRMLSDWANLEGGRCRSLVMYAIRLTRKTRNARLPEIQALKDLIVTLPGFEVSKEVEAGDSDEGLAVNATGEDSEGEGQEDDEEEPGKATATKEASLPTTSGAKESCPSTRSNAKKSAPATTSDAKESAPATTTDAKEPSGESQECPLEVGQKEKVGAALRDSKPLLPEGAVIPPGIAQQLEALDPEEAASLLEAQQNMKAEIRNENKRKAAAKCEAKIAKAKAKAKAKDSAKKRKGEDNDAMPKEKAEETKPMAADPATKPKPSKDHTIQDMLEMLEPAFAIGLPQPTEQSKQKKCYTVPAPGLGCASISVMAGSTKNFFVNRGASGGLPKFLREILGLKMDTNFNTGISIRRFGAAFAYEVALVIACHRTLEPPALCAEDVRRRFKELFSHSPQDLLIMTG